MPTFDGHTNFALTTVATAPSPTASGTSLVVASGDGALFPASTFNATVCPAGQTPTHSNAEIIRVTRSGDNFTIARAQEGTAARSIIAGDQIMAAVTAKTLTDIEAAVGSGGGGTGGGNYQTVQAGGAAQVQRPIVDFIAGQGMTVTAADDSGNSRTTITFAVTSIDGGASI